MTYFTRMIGRKLRVLALGVCLCIPICAQESPGSATAAKAVAPPLLEPPVPKPPVELFRNLLSMTPAERRDFLAKRSPEAQKLILAKIREYEALKPEARELRLRVTELRWYLLPLLSTSATNRTAQLNAVPSELRQLVEDRLREWDKLSVKVQKELLDNESTVRFYFELAASSPEQRFQTVANIPAASREQIASGLR